ncbi:MAG: hypothetical protein Q4D06_04735 [Coriobacteriia bacterium]|nr:hypothetical protein [Coriobacteriia bacterium]
MPEPSVTRRFLGTCRLARVQVARAAESFDQDQAYARLLECGKLNQDDVDFLIDFLSREEPVKAGEVQLDEEWALAAIHRVHGITASKLNMGDSA